MGLNTSWRFIWYGWTWDKMKRCMQKVLKISFFNVHEKQNSIFPLLFYYFSIHTHTFYFFFSINPNNCILNMKLNIGTLQKKSLLEPFVCKLIWGNLSNESETAEKLEIFHLSVNGGWVFTFWTVKVLITYSARGSVSISVTLMSPYSSVSSGQYRTHFTLMDT